MLQLLCLAMVLFAKLFSIMSSEDDALFAEVLGAVRIATRKARRARDAAVSNSKLKSQVCRSAVHQKHTHIHIRSPSAYRKFLICAVSCEYVL